MSCHPGSVCVIEWYASISMIEPCRLRTAGEMPVQCASISMIEPCRLWKAGEMLMQVRICVHIDDKTVPSLEGRCDADAGVGRAFWSRRTCVSVNDTSRSSSRSWRCVRFCSLITSTFTNCEEFPWSLVRYGTGTQLLGSYGTYKLAGKADPEHYQSINQSEKYLTCPK